MLDLRGRAQPYVVREQRLHFVRVLLDIRERITAFAEARIHESVIGTKDLALVVASISFQVDSIKAVDRGLAGSAESPHRAHPRVITNSSQVRADQLEKAPKQNALRTYKSDNEPGPAGPPTVLCPVDKASVSRPDC